MNHDSFARRTLRRGAPIAAAAAIGAGTGAGVYALTSTQGSTSATSATPTAVVPAQPASTRTTTDSLTQLYKNATPGVVDITVDSTTPSNSFTTPFGPGGQQETQAEGSGFVIDTKGDILTAQHVVDGANSITVRFQDGSTTKATVVGTDQSTDVAVIKVSVDASKLHPLALGSSADALPGQDVVAIGSPFGLPETMTSGIVSAVNRTITAPNNYSISGAIQTDAAINHGNSGGPLIDVATNTVIGINDQILNAGDTNDNAGVGFAVPIDKSKAVAATLIGGGTVQHAYVGVLIQNATGGAKVTKIVAGSPAAKSALKVGDVITAFDGHAITSASDLTGVVATAKVGKTVSVTVHRDGSVEHLSITLGSQPATATS